MPLSPDEEQQLQHFFDKSNFVENGWIITDMDGTVIVEEGGEYHIPRHVVIGLKKMYDMGRPIVINTLRFPLSVMRTYNKVWFSNFDCTVPAVLMNGSQLVEFTKTGEDDFTCSEITAFPLTDEEINDVVKRVIGMVVGNDTPELLVFYYPRNWEMGEIIWTPDEKRIPQIQEKYRSASLVYHSTIEELHHNLKAEDICMMFILVDLPQDKQLAYQHKRKKDFVTSKGVNKLYGTRQIAHHLGLQMEASLGAGDTDMDTFLNGVALPVHVSNSNLNFKNEALPVKVENPAAFGDLLIHLASLQKEDIDTQ